MKKKKAIILILCIIAVISISVVGYIGCSALRSIAAFLEPTNDRDNADPAKRKGMIQLSTEWGRLAPFPDSKRNFTIKTEGNVFTRSFRGSFSDSPDAIHQWVLESPGIQEGEIEPTNDGSTQYNLKMGSGASYGEVIISSDGEGVMFYVAWS